MKKIAYAVSMALGMGIAATAQSAVPIPIDPDGAGAATSVQVGNLDWAPGNALAVGPGTFAGRQVGTTFQLYAQATLGAFRTITNTIINGTGLGSNYEWTYVTSFTEMITGVANGGQSLQFQVNPGNTGYDAATNFFNIYRSPVNSSDLAGRGFNDGDLILRGHILQGNQFGDSGFNVSGNFNPATGVFTPTIQNLDQFGVNNYSGAGGSAAHQTITGSGASSITVVVDAFDADTFQNIDVGFAFTLDFNTSQILAYNQTDPSSCFWDGAAFIGGAGATTNPAVPTPCANTIGATNGVSGPNIMFQTDSNNSFTAVVPEPGVLALLGISLLGFGMARRRS